ncbi:putative ribonuclease H-like domain-containing protein, partial [Tanacetum coccineum]
MVICSVEIDIVIEDTSWFTVTESKKWDGYPAVLGNCCNIDSQCLMVIVYSPQGLRDKEMLWNDLTRLIDNPNDFSIILGDFNEVRSETEILGTVFYRRSASEFNDFIHSSGLCDLTMGDKRFTRMNNHGSKHSKLDRFLVSNHVLQLWPNSNVTALPCEFSDHTPLLFKNAAPDYGQTSFKLYNSWLDYSEFPVLLEASLSLSVFGLPSTSPSSTSLASGFPLHSETVAFLELLNKINSLDNKAESSFLSPFKVDERNSSVKLLANLEQCKVKDLRKKAKIRWAVVGDENSHFFHGIINSRRHRSRINGLNILEEWITEPSLIKNHVYNSFCDRFKENNRSRPLFSSGLFKQLSLEESYSLDCPFMLEEIKAADFEVLAFILQGCNSSFITLVPKVDDPLVVGDFRPISLIGRQIIDGPLMVDEIIAWAKKYKKRIMFLKVDFEKAFDSLRLKFNFNKSKLYGIGTSNVELCSLASTIGCLASQFPCTYLGLLIGAKMSWCHNWNPLVDRFHKRFSKWKSKTLFIGWRLTLIKSVLGSLGVYYFSTFKDPIKVINKLKVAFLEKPTESEGFEEIIDFLNANPIKYALTVNPIVYLDKKKAIITESTIRRDLQLEDVKVKNVDSMVQFWMYPRFVQVFVNKQVGDMSHHKRIFVTPSYTKKIFENMKREGKGFSGRVTPLFQTMMVQAHEEIDEGSEIPTDPHHTPIIQPSTSQPQKKQSRRKQRKDTEIPQSSGPTEHIADEVANEEHVPTQSNDPPLSRVNTLRSGEDRLSLKELMDLCTKLSNRVLDLETTKTAQAKEIASLKKRVKKMERKRKLKSSGMKRLFKIGRSAQVVSSEDEGLGDQEDTSKHGKKIADIDADAEEVEVEKVVSTAEVSIDSSTTTTVNELTLAQTLIEIKAAKPKVRGVMIQEPSEFTTTTTTTTPAASKPSQDKGKAKMTEPEKPLKKKDQIMYDQEVALNLQAQLQAELEEEERLARQKEEKANIALIESWDNTQEMMDADRLLAERLQAREQEELTNEEKARLFVELLDKRKKHFAGLRAQEKRNKPPTKTQKKSTMSTYLKHMAGYKQSQLKNKSFAESQKLVDKAMTRVNMFVDMDTELVEGSEKRAE